MRGDSYSSGASSGAENSLMVAVGRDRGRRERDCGRDSRGGRGHEDKGPHYYAHCGRLIIYQISARTSLVNQVGSGC